MAMNSKKRKFLATSLTATMVASAVAPVAGFAAEEQKPFPDVELGTPYTDPITKLAEAGVIKGYADGTFKIRGKVTRAEAAQMFTTIRDLNTKVANAPFADVKQGVWYSDAINAAYAAGIIKGNPDGSFKPNGNLTRAELAVMVVEAYGLEMKTDVKLPFTDVKEDVWYTDYIKTLYANDLIAGKTPTTFAPGENVDRGDFAILLAGTDEKFGDKLDDVITGDMSVTVINDTKIEVKFAKALDKDIAREIEDDKKRFVIYHGGQTPYTDGVIKSEFISFNDDYTVATIDLNDVPDVDINYTVALMSDNDNTTADVMLESKQLVLKEGAEKPSLTVNADQDKFILDFKVKMAGDIIDTSANNFDLEDVADKNSFIEDNKMIMVLDNNGKFVGDIKDLAESGTVKWVDATTKKAIEFKIEPGKLEAGKKYTVKIGKGVETDDGDVLSDSKRTIRVDTPSIDKARPEAKFARVTGPGEIQVVFDKDLDNTATINPKLVDVKTATGKILDIDTIEYDNDNPKIITITLDEEELKDNQTYKVDIQANVVANNVFQNALNKSTTGVQAKAQADTPITKMTAKFERQTDNKDKADLLLTFDQRVKLPSSASDIGSGLTIEEGGTTYTFNGAATIEYDVNDSTGKTLRIKDITSDAFDNDLKLKSDKSYKVKIARNTVKTDSMAGDTTNNVELSATISGIDVTAPVVDNVTFVSDSKMIVEFDKEINTSVSPSDVYVLGYKLYRSGEFSDLVALNDKNHISVSVSGKKLTITAKDNDIKFVTGAMSVTNAADLFGGNTATANTFFRLKADKVKGTNDVEAPEQVLAFADSATDSGAVELAVAGGDTEAIDAFDYAAPVMIGAAVTANDKLSITYSENIEFKDEKEAGRQYTFEGAETKNYGTVAAAVDSTDKNVVRITFKDKNGTEYSDGTVLDAKAYSSLKVTFTRNATYELLDTNNNAAKKQTITGAVKRTE